MAFDLDNFKNDFLETSGINNYKKLYNKARNIKLGPYRSYDLKIFEIHPSEDVTNESNRIILDSFANLAVDNSSWRSIWKPVIQGRDPFGLEVFSDGIHTTFHLLLPPDYADFMIRKVYGVFQGSRIVAIDKAEDYMLRFNNYGVSDIYHIDLKDHPVMPYRMDISPIANNIAEALEVLEPGEIACIQILLQPLIADWQSKYKFAYHKYKETDKLPPFGTNYVRYIVSCLEGLLNLIGSLFKKKSKDSGIIHRFDGINFESELDKAVKQKLQSNGFRTSIKITVQSDNPEKRSSICRNLSSGITNLSRYNSFLTKKYFDMSKEKAINKFKDRSITKESFMSCSHEAANLISLTDANVNAPMVKKAFPKERPVSPIVSHGKIYIGDTLPYQEKRLPVRLASKSFNEMHRTTIFLAPPGFGKTTLAKTIALQRKKLGLGSLVADIADGDLVDGVLRNIDSKDFSTTAYLDFTDKTRLPSLSLDMIEGSPEMRADLFVEWFEQMMNLSDNAPRAKVYLKKYALSCLSVDGYGLTEFKLLLDGDVKTIEHVKSVLRKKNPALYHWWTTKYNEKVVENLEAIRYRLEDLFETDTLRLVFSNNTSSIDFKKMINEGYLIAVNLCADKVSTKVQQVIMSFIFLVMWSVALSRADFILKDIKPRSFALLLDEPYTYIHKTQTIETAVNKFRKYGFALNIFMHDADQIIRNSAALWEEIVSSGPNLILGFISDKSRKSLRSHFPNLSTAEYENMFSMVQNRDDHYFICKAVFDEGLVEPFIFESAFTSGKKLHIDILKTFKNKYAPLTREEVDKRYFAKLYGMTPEQYEQSILEAEKGGEAEWVSKDEEEVKELESGI